VAAVPGLPCAQPRPERRGSLPARRREPPKHSAEGFGYSDALLSQDGDWTPENLSAFLENPRGYAPGTAMAYNGMSDVEDRANLIAYLATQQ
jgi:cytochrome c